jgi:hypothetical protein
MAGHPIHAELRPRSTESWVVLVAARVVAARLAKKWERELLMHDGLQGRLNEVCVSLVSVVSVVWCRDLGSDS